MKIFKYLISIAVTTAMLNVIAESPQALEESILTLQQEWAKVNYTLKDDEQEEAFEALIKKAEQQVANFPNRAEPLIWQGIILSSYAGATGGLDALSYAKQSRSALEQALKIDENALAGSAYTSLGTLYHKVPGWPIGFGDDDDAKVYLEKALAINPDGIDPNYFYGEYLYDEGEYQKAKQVLEHALEAPERPMRPLADSSRKVEIQALLVKVDKKLNKRRRRG